MNVRTAVLVALVVLAPAAALAQAEERPDWSIGAGLGVNGLTFLPAAITAAPTSVILSSSLFGAAVPVATFFVERRVGDRTWLVFGAAGTLSRRSFDAPPDTGTTTFTVLTKDDSEIGSVSVGLRRVVTRPGAVVEVSLQATVEGGALHEQQEFTSNGGVKSSIRDIGGYASVTGGIVVERELTGGLGLRISTPLVGASYSTLERRDAAGTRDASSASVFVTLAPRLELRLAF
jgi:hypothetical protein